MDKMKDNSKSLEFITWMQMIACFLVVLGHSYPFVGEIPTWAIDLRAFIYCFHMPIFIWCSGYLMVATRQAEKYTFLQYLKRRSVRILLPYLVFSLIGLVPKILFQSVLNDSMSLDLIGVVRAFFVPRESIWGHFWFLPMIFVLGIAGYLILRLIRKITSFAWGGVIVGVSCFIGFSGFFAPRTTDWFVLNDIIKYMGYIFLGMLCAILKIKFDKITTAIITCVSIILSITLFMFLPKYKIVVFGISILMIIFVWTLSVLLEIKCSINRKAIYTQTYPIFILAWPCQLLVQIVLDKILGLPFIVVCPAMFIVGLSAPLLIIWLIILLERKTKKKIFSWIIGM